MQAKRAREIFLACAFVFCGCKKHESIATTTSLPASSESVASASPIERASASSEPTASASAAPLASGESEAEKRARKQAALREAAEFGMLGLIGADDGGAGGTGDVNLGTIGHGSGTGAATGYTPNARQPSVRLGVLSVNGRLPPEVVQRVIRRELTRFRVCYETGLRLNPSLEGRVSTKLVIDASGHVGSAQDGGSDLPDQNVVQCVVRAFGNITFPAPEGGIVTVVAPVLFSPPRP